MNDGKKVAKEATMDAETTDKANVLPPFAAPAGQLDAGALDVSKVVSVLRKNRKPKQGSAHESVVVTFGPMGISAADKFHREFSEIVWRDRASSLSQKCDQSLPAGSAKGGNTNTESGSDIATTTSTVSAPCPVCNDSGIVGFPPDQYESCPECTPSSTEGAQKAPEEVRNQALQSIANDGLDARQCMELARRALRTSSTDQATADTGSAE